VNTYYKYGPTLDSPAPHWYEFLFDGTTGAEILSDRVVLHFVDGQRGDDDLAANGQIVEPGAPALSNRPPTANAGPDVTIHWTEWSSTVISGQAFDPDPNTSLTYRWLDVTGSESILLLGWTPTGPAGEAYLDLGALDMFAIGDSMLRLEVSDGELTASDEMVLTVTNAAPVADAGDNLMIASEEQSTTVIQASAYDPDGDCVQYRWFDMTEAGAVLLLAWSATAPGGEARLDLGLVATLSVGEHALWLEVSDGWEYTQDTMVLTIENSPPDATITGCGTY
jgi:hypothetical protein